MTPQTGTEKGTLMPTSEKLYLSDAYARMTEGRVLAHAQGADGEAGIILDRSLFYPAGGGQPGRRGAADLGRRAMCGCLHPQGR